MTPDMKRLVEAANAPITALFAGEDITTEAIVRAVLTELREVCGETEGYREGLWSRRNVEALIRDILTEPATA